LAGIRIWPIRGFDKILIIYAVDRTGIDVLRVVHGARDLDVLELDPP
jgi:toxin ParE1/3/4